MTSLNESESNTIPLTILTGFLGAGKTTLLKHILNGEHGLRVAVLVNDFGSINIDAELVVSVESDVVSLANGCVCCTIRDDLVSAIHKVIDRLERPEYVILESSGVADPAGIATTFATAEFSDRMRLDSIICVVDAEQVFAAEEHMQIKLWQIGTADLVILNKVDLVGHDQINKIETWLERHFHRYRLLTASRCDLPMSILLGSGRFDPALLGWTGANNDYKTCQKVNCREHGHHDQAFSTWTYETNRPMSLEALQESAARLPNNIYRCKGVVYSTDAPDKRAILQVVGKRVIVSLENPWEERPRSTQIVVIGAAGSIDHSSIQELFDGCLGDVPKTSDSLRVLQTSY